MTLTLRLEVYTVHARQVVQAAQLLAEERGHAEVEPIHLLHRLADYESVQEAFRRASVDPADVMVETEAQIRRIPKFPDAVAYLSSRFLDVLSRAEGEAAREGGAQIDIEHLTVSVAQETTGSAYAVFRSVGLSAPILRAMFRAESTAEARPTASALAGSAAPARPSANRPAVNASNALSQYGRDLTKLAAEGHFDPAVGRDEELRRIIQVLARRRDNNPLLVGEAGIGKTTIVEALAMRIARGDVPAMLAGKRIVSLETGVLVAGAKLRGELEERVRTLLDALRDSGGEVILFLHDLGAIFGERAPSGVADLLVPALSRGEVRAIAVATPEEARKIEAEDSQILRRFVSISVEPPTAAESVAMLRGLAPRLESAHGVRISDRALVSAVHLAKRYVPSAQLPRAAVDLVDEAAALVRVQMESASSERDAVNRRIETLKVQLESLADDLDDDSRAAAAKLEGELRAAEATFGADAPSRRSDSVVHADDVAAVVHAWTGVPVTKMLESEAQKLLTMEARLGERVIGQTAAVEAVSRAVRRGRAGLRDPKRPIGSFLFLGPTGVGKTELAKAVAEFLFDDEAALARLDMSEFMEKHSVARLIGAPPGYVDSQEGGFLTEAVRRKPYSVVLFDEVEKGHPDVFNILLQVLDDGRLSDSRGRMAHFADTVIIMTSNIGGRAITDHEGDEEELRGLIQEELKKFFRPEFLNRIDDVVIFGRLSKETLRGIVDVQLKQLDRLLGERRIHIEVTGAAKDHLTDLGYDPAFGARPLKRVILKNLQDPLAEEVLSGGYAPGDSVLVDVADGRFVFSKR